LGLNCRNPIQTLSQLIIVLCQTDRFFGNHPVIVIEKTH